VKRAILAAVLLLAAITVAYGYTVTRRERVYRQLVVQGEYALVRGDTFTAVSTFGDAIALKPDSMLGYLKRGDAHRRRGDFEAAAADLETARTLDPSSPRAFELLGDVNVARQLPDRAAEDYEASIRLDDRAPRVLYKLALSRHVAGKHPEAVEALRQAVQLDARFAEAHYLLGVCLLKMRQVPAAQAAFERAVAVAPGLLPAREQLADVYGMLGRRSSRLRQLEELLVADGGPARQVTLGLAYAEAGQMARAVRLLSSAAGMYPDHARIYLAVGRVWLAAASEGPDHVALAKAIEALEHAATMDASSEALTLLGQARLAASEAAAAERTLRQATDTLPADPDAFLSLAEAAERLGHVQVARQALVDYQALTGAADPSFLLRLARTHWRAGDATSARATVETVLRTDPDNQAARTLERSLH
jgi:tetratricopeptide (TPR) repeat protein